MFAPEIPDALPCDDALCDECRPEIAAQVLDGRGAE